MKIAVWIRPADGGRNIKLKLDTKLENLDTPVIQRFGFKLANAIEGTGSDGEND